MLTEHPYVGPARLKEFVQNGLVYPHAPAISAIATNAGGLCREALHDMDELMRLAGTEMLATSAWRSG